MRRRITNALGTKETNAQSDTLQKTKTYTITHTRGGSYHRVSSITVNENPDRAEMVLRVARMGMPVNVKQDVTILQFLQKHTQTPAPLVIARDITDENPLKEPYVILKRIPGHVLESKTQPYTSLSHEQKILFVEEFCNLLLAMQKIRHPWAKSRTQKPMAKKTSR